MYFQISVGSVPSNGSLNETKPTGHPRGLAQLACFVKRLEQSCRQSWPWTDNRQTDRQTDRQTTDRQTDRQTDRRTDRDTQRQLQVGTKTENL